MAGEDAAAEAQTKALFGSKMSDSSGRGRNAHAEDVAGDEATGWRTGEADAAANDARAPRCLQGRHAKAAHMQAANERTFDDVFDDLFVGGQSRHELEQLRDNASQ